MAATGYTPIYLYYSSTATNTPTAGNLGNGELAINIADGKLFYKDSGAAVQVIAAKDAASGIFSTASGVAVNATATTSGTALYGDSSSGNAVRGGSATGIGGYFVTTAGIGQAVYANSTGGYGVDGRTGSASYGGVIGFASNTSYYGILGYSTYGGYFIGNGYVSLSFYNPGHGTTASAANAFINSSSGLLGRSTSSGRYKKDIEPLWDSIGDKLLNAEPIFYRSNELTIDDPKLSWYSFLAEDLAKLDPRFVIWGKEPKRDESGNIVYTTAIGPNGEETQETVYEEQDTPNGISSTALIAALTNLVQRQHKDVEELKKKVQTLSTPAA